MVWALVLWHVLGVSDPALFAGALLLLAVAAVVLRTTLRSRDAGTPLPRLRRRPPAPGVPRHRDPDAAGHARPRAPGAVPATA